MYEFNEDYYYKLNSRRSSSKLILQSYRLSIKWGNAQNMSIFAVARVLFLVFENY